MLNTWSFPCIFDAVIDAAEPTSVFRMAQVYQQWRHAVQSRLYHLKVYKMPLAVPPPLVATPDPVLRLA